MRYAVHASDGMPLAMLGFSSAAWTLAPRDRFIGWSRRHREKNLPLVVDNPRFLILPWIHIPNLGSHILALVRRQLPACRACGRPVDVALALKVGEAGAHRPLEVSREIAADHACAGAARLPHSHSGSSSRL